MLLLLNLEAALAPKNWRLSSKNALLVHCLPVLYPGIISLGLASRKEDFVFILLMSCLPSLQLCYQFSFICIHFLQSGVMHFAILSVNVRRFFMDVTICGLSQAHKHSLFYNLCFANVYSSLFFCFAFLPRQLRTWSQIPFVWTLGE